jgi:hypothetical protein
MKVGMRVTFVLAIAVLLTLHWLLFRETEGFYDDSSDYTRLSANIKSKLANYCKLADLIRQQVITGYAGTNPDSASSATEEVNNEYREMYMCTDDKASSRPSCSKPNATGMSYTSSDTYMKLPSWTDEISAVTALVKIKDDLPERVTREADYFEQIIKQLQSFVETGANPPTAPPTEDQINSLKEPFTDGCCPQQLELLRQLTRDSKTRSLPNLASEINRLNTLLVNPILVVALAKCDSLLVRMSKIQTQLDKLKKGELYEWQKDGPSKSYEQFGGGDNTKALLFSLRQNQ